MKPLITPKRSNADMLRVVSSCLEAIDSPVSLSVYLRVKHAVQELPDISPRHYLTAYDYAKDAQALALVSKSSFFRGPSHDDLKESAIIDFFNAEKRCLDTNVRVRNRLILGDLDLLLARVATHVEQILLDHVPNDIWTQSKLLFGPGATSSCKWPLTTYLHKIVGRPEITSGCIDLLHTISGEQYAFDDFSVVNANRFTTVPKSWKQLRGICIEPHLNTHFQRCIGVAMVGRLARAGIKLAEVPYENCWKLSTSPHKYATIDLKQASDSISKEIVMSTFPPIWSHWMARTRASRTVIAKDLPPIELEKWSSMGNGYTFEAETILFLAVCRSIVPVEEWHEVTVFGDDMIVPVKYGQEVVEALGQMGFIVNTDKTFLEGPFKESCGFDVWDGSPVRAIYIKEVPNSEDPKSFIHLVNTIRRISLRLCGDRPGRTQWKHAYKAVLSWVLPDLRRHVGPDPYYEHDLLGVHLVKRVQTKIGPRYVFIDEPERHALPVERQRELQFKPFERLGCDSWLHHDDAPVPKVRLITETRHWDTERFPPGVQMLYALSGGDSKGPAISGPQGSSYLK